jgi:hypothetical protein
MRFRRNQIVACWVGERSIECPSLREPGGRRSFEAGLRGTEIKFRPPRPETAIRVAAGQFCEAGWLLLSSLSVHYCEEEADKAWSKCSMFSARMVISFGPGRTTARNVDSLLLK